MRVGVDEAGKGPVLGPMVAAAVGVPEPAVLPDGVADSKRLAPERRRELAERLRADETVAVGVATVPVERIDDPETDMNTLTVRAHATALDAVRADGSADAAAWTVGDDAVTVGEGAAGDGAPACDEPAVGSAEAALDKEAASTAGPTTADCTVLADAGDTSEERFARRLRRHCAGDPTVAARHGADDDDPVVAAASVVAKVERDARVAALAEGYGDVGSGYPSDPTTRSFLAEYVREHGALPDCARSSWQTCSDVLAAAEQSGLEEF